MTSRSHRGYTQLLCWGVRATFSRFQKVSFRLLFLVMDNCLSSLVLFPPPTWQRDTWRKLYSTVFLPFQKSYVEGVLWRTWLYFQNLWIMFLTFSGFFSAIAKIITHLRGLLLYLIFIRRSKNWDQTCRLLALSLHQCMIFIIIILNIPIIIISKTC